MIEIREQVSCPPFSDSCAMSNSPPQNGNTQKTKWKSKIVILWDIYWSHFTLCRHWIPAFSLTNHQKNFDSDNTWLCLTKFSWSKFSLTKFLMENFDSDNTWLCLTKFSWSKFSCSKFSLTKFLMENFDSDNKPLLYHCFLVLKSLL